MGKLKIKLSDSQIDVIITSLRDRSDTLDYFFQNDNYGDNEKEEYAIIKNLLDILENIKYGKELWITQ